MSRRRIGPALVAAVGLVVPAVAVFALDPPHDATNTVECMSCHDPHSAAGGKLNIAEENANVCMTCHTAGGLAAAKPFSDSDQALPGISGTSHRFDSGPSGHSEPDAANTSTGTVRSGGAFTGRVERVYTVAITSSGNVGTATYSWWDDAGGSGSGTTATSVTLNDGITANFSNGDGSPSFVGPSGAEPYGDFWTIYVRMDLRLPDPDVPAEAALAAALDENDKVVCSTCHNQHSQEKQPFDTSAPAYTGEGTGEGRHYQRIDNDANQMCVVCHSPRDVSAAVDGSHPIRVTVPTGSDWTSPTEVPLWEGDKVMCLTCHYPHNNLSGTGSTDGYILRETVNTLCLECHALADTTSGSHFNTSTGALWPGGQYGSSAPAHPISYRGACVNCHWPHGWDDDDNTDTEADFPRLWLEQYDVADDRSDPSDAEDLCYTCHDASPATSNIRGDITKGTNTSTATYHHPVMDTEQTSGRSVECVDCHNPHEATNSDRHAGVSGVDLTGAEIPAGSRALAQYELCFKCHGDTYNSTRPNTSNKRLDFAETNSAYHPVTQMGRNQSANLTSSLSGSGLTTTSTIRCTDCHNSDSFSGTTGAISDTPLVTVGPHGSTYSPILRANLNTNYTSSTTPSSFSASNYQLCFRCHSQTRLMARRWSDGARTNFYDSIDGRDNLHWVHLDDRASKARATCMSCHFDIHSNISASNTQYRIDSTLYSDNEAVSAARYKTHMVNFSPDIRSYGGRSKPEWWINTSTRERRCYLSCHGYDMTGYQYRPPSGDETTWTY